MSVNIFECMVGKTMSAVNANPRAYEMVFTSEDGHVFKFYHEQDCCEQVYIEDIAGDISDLIGSPILMAEEVSEEPPKNTTAVDQDDSYTWTFYKFATNKGSVTVRWLGVSNGYYSESVDFEHIKPAQHTCTACQDTGFVTDTEGKVWPCYRKCASCASPIQDIKSFEEYEIIGIGIPNPRSVAKITGSPEMLERILAFALQSGEEVSGITEEERKRYLAMDIEV